MTDRTPARIPEEQALIRRLAEMGITATPGAAGPNDPLPQLVRLNGVSLSETVIQMRREP